MSRAGNCGYRDIIYFVTTGGNDLTRARDLIWNVYLVLTCRLYCPDIFIISGPVVDLIGASRLSDRLCVPVPEAMCLRDMCNWNVS